MRKIILIGTIILMATGAMRAETANLWQKSIDTATCPVRTSYALMEKVCVTLEDTQGRQTECNKGLSFIIGSTFLFLAAMVVQNIIQNYLYKTKINGFGDLLRQQGKEHLIPPPLLIKEENNFICQEPFSPSHHPQKFFDYVKTS